MLGILSFFKFNHKVMYSDLLQVQMMTDMPEGVIFLYNLIKLFFSFLINNVEWFIVRNKNEKIGTPKKNR